jgi:hypothetical protein
MDLLAASNSKSPNVLKEDNQSIPQEIDASQCQGNDNNCTECDCKCDCHGLNKKKEKEGANNNDPCCPCKCECKCHENEDYLSQQPNYNATRLMMEKERQREILTSEGRMKVPRSKTPTRKDHLALVIYNASENKCGKFRNGMVLNSNVIKAYGEGLFVGQAIEKSIITKVGVWKPAWGFGLMAFNTEDDSHSFLHTDTDFADWFWMDQTDIVAMPIAGELKSIEEYPVCCLDMVENKGTREARALKPSDINDLKMLVRNNNGSLLVATNKILRERGSRNFHYICISQWPNMDSFNKFQDAATGQRDEKGGVRVVATMEPLSAVPSIVLELEQKK